MKRMSEDENVEKRQKKINVTYNQLLDLAQVSGELDHLVKNSKYSSHDCVIMSHCLVCKHIII